MRPDELRQYAERVKAEGERTIAAATEFVPRTEGEGRWAGRATALATLVVDWAERWLAEHPADGGEPVTAEWLEATGGKKQFNGIYTFSLPESDHGSRICVGFYPGFDNAVLQLLPSSRNSLPALAPAPTRGHVRRLLAALGITLTESTPCPASSATPSPSDPSRRPS